MNIVVAGQDETWIRQLSHLCKKRDIEVYQETDEAEMAEVHLLVTEFPADSSRKGIFSEIPFLVVSKEDSEEKMLEAFSMGADDYLVKPVSPEIAAARIHRILCRYGEWRQKPKELHEDIHFTPNEYRILAHLMSSPGKVFSRSDLIEEGLGESYQGFDRGIDNYIKQIRSKIEVNPAEPEHILTVHGIGYKYIP